MGNEFWISSDRSIACSDCGGVLLNVFGPKQWSDATWDEYLTYVHAISDPPPPISRSITYVSSATPTAVQRERLRRQMGDLDPLLISAIVTQSAAARTAAKAFQLMSRVMRSKISLAAFAPGHAANAFTWLEANGAQVSAECAPLFMRMMAAVGYGKDRMAAVIL
jgi:hypothetical protein